MHSFSDNPVHNLSDDIFGFSRHVTSVKNALVGAKDLPLCIGIFGIRVQSAYARVSRKYRSRGIRGVMPVGAPVYAGDQGAMRHGSNITQSLFDGS